MKKKSLMSQIILIAFFTVLCFMLVFPFLLLVSISLSSEADISAYGYSVLPKTLDFTAYKFVFSNPKSILNAYKITGIFSVVSMVLGVLLMAMIAYPLSRRKLRGRNFLSFFLYFTMLFSGGLVPTYILITKYLHLADSIWVYILPVLISPWNVFMIRTSFQNIPEEIIESAHVDGAEEYTIFFRMILPLSKPILATIALFVFLNKWNDWNTSMLYINKPELYSLQYLLQKIMKDIQLLQDSMSADMLQQIVEIPGETARMAMAVVVAGPALVVFPFFQKYFVKGITVGSVKG